MIIPTFKKVAVNLNEIRIIILKMLSKEPIKRLNDIIEMAWQIIFERIVSGFLIINKESSLQLHLSKIIFDLGNIYCILPEEKFNIEMETNYKNKSIDIVCSLAKARAAIELKCFIKSSNRAKDLDMYDALIDVERLQNYEGFELKKFICLTDNKYYPLTEQTGHAKTVTLKHGTIYAASQPIIPGWVDKWKVNRNKSILFNNDICCNWVTQDKWHYLKIDI